MKRPGAVSLRPTIRGHGLLQRVVVSTTVTSEPLPSSEKYIVQVPWMAVADPDFRSHFARSV